MLLNTNNYNCIKILNHLPGNYYTFQILIYIFVL
jgi:hypothetical protein